MFIGLRRDLAEAAVPFRSGEEAWFWTMAIVLARRDGAVRGGARMRRRGLASRTTSSSP